MRPLLETLCLIFAVLLAPAWAVAQSGQMTQAPKLLEGAQAEYPAAALRERVAGKVELLIQIDEKGAVSEVELLKTSTQAEDLALVRNSTISDYGFNSAAEQAARRLVFSPAHFDGEPASVKIGYSFQFALPPKPEPSSAKTPEKAGPSVVTLSGRVRSKGTRKLLVGAVVTAYKKNGSEGYEAISDDEGRWSFYDLRAGSWQVRVEVEGYLPAEATEEVLEAQVTEVDYYLRPGRLNRYDVLVEVEPARREVTRRELRVEDLVKIPGTMGDPLMTVENLPGVARGVASNGIAVRGTSPDGTGVYVNGVRILNYDHIGGLRSVIPAQMIEKVDFFPGTYSASFGRSEGALIDVRLKKLAPDQVHGAVDVSLLDVGAYLEVPITDTFAVAVAGRRSHIDVVLDAAVPEDASISLTAAPRYYDYQILASFRPNANHTFQLFGMGSDDAMELLFADASSAISNAQSSVAKNSANFQRVAFEYQYTPDNGIRNELTLAYGRDEFFNSAFGVFNIGALFHEFTLRETLSWQMSKNVLLRAGLDGRNFWADYDVTASRPPREGELRVQAEEEFITTKGRGVYFGRNAAFVEGEFSLPGNVLFVPGGRLEHYELTDEWLPEARAVANWQMLPEFTLKGGVGIVHQAPDIDQSDIAFGNPALSPQRTIQYSVGAQWKPVNYLDFDVALFYKDMENVIVPTGELTQRNGQAVPLRYSNGGSGRAYGFELLAKHNFHNNFKAWVSYTLSRSERENEAGEPARLFDFDQTHILTLVASYLFPLDWELGVRWRFVSGNPTTPYLGSIFVADADTFEPVPGAQNSSRLPAFHQLDVRIDKKWVFDTWSMTTYLSVTNAYNRANVEALGHSYDYRQTEEVTGLPILPILGIKGEF